MDQASGREHALLVRSDAYDKPLKGRRVRAIAAAQCEFTQPFLRGISRGKEALIRFRATSEGGKR
jgi:hypothetical protein